MGPPPEGRSRRRAALHPRLLPHASMGPPPEGRSRSVRQNRCHTSNLRGALREVNRIAAFSGAWRGVFEVKAEGQTLHCGAGFSGSSDPRGSERHRTARRCYSVVNERSSPRGRGRGGSDLCRQPASGRLESGGSRRGSVVGRPITTIAGIWGTLDCLACRPFGGAQALRLALANDRPRNRGAALGGADRSGSDDRNLRVSVRLLSAQALEAFSGRRGVRTDLDQ